MAGVQWWGGREIVDPQLLDVAHTGRCGLVDGDEECVGFRSVGVPLSGFGREGFGGRGSRMSCAVSSMGGRSSSSSSACRWVEWNGGEWAELSPTGCVCAL